MLRTLRRSWEKNWPEVRAALARELPPFVMQRDPAPLSDGVPVFCYHTVDRTQFEQDLIFLKRNGYVPIDANRLVSHLRGQCTAPKNAVALTFDDGPVNFYEAAYPCLLKHGMQAVAFVAGAFPCEHTSGSLKLRDHCASGTTNPYRPATWEELRQMQQSGLVDIQAHTYQHRYIPRWPEPRPLTGVDQARVEPRRVPALSLPGDLVLARRVLEHHLEKPVRHLALPDYDGTPRALRCAHALGYASCWWGLAPGRAGNHPGQSPYRIVRISGEFVRRLPGQGRLPLRTILARRYAANLPRFIRKRQSAV